MDEDSKLRQADRHGAPASERCLNCQSPLQGPYCSECGQRAENPRRLVIGLVQDVIVDTLSIDSKLARTLSMLFLRPASLARDYLDGRRVRYTAPFRLYLFSSLVFFLILWTLVPMSAFEDGLRESSDPGEVTVTAPEPPDERATEPAGEPLEAAPDDEAAFSEGEDAEVSAGIADEDGGEGEEMFDGVDEIDCGLEGGPPDTLGERFCVGTREVLLQFGEASERVSEDPRLFLLQVRSNIPRALLVAPVVYALIMLLLYVYRRRVLVYDHLVVSLYMHAALYAYLSIFLLAGRLPVIGGLASLVLLWGWVQAFLVFRRSYGSGWVSTVLKFSVQTTLYYFAVLLLLVLGLGYSLYQS